MSAAPSVLDWIECLALGNEGVGPAAAQHALADDGLLPGHRHCPAHPRRHAAATSRRAGRTCRARRPRACPRGQHRFADGLRQLHGIDHHVADAAVRAGRNHRRETASAAMTFDGSMPSSLRGRVAIGRLHLRAEIQVAAVGAHVGEAVERLHRRMREVGQLVFHVQLASPRRAARPSRRRVAGHGARRIATGADTRGAAPRSRKLVAAPSSQSITSASRPRLAAKVLRAIHGDTRGNLLDVDHAGHGARGAVIQLERASRR